MRKKIAIAMIITVLLINMLIPNLIFADIDDVGRFQDVIKQPIDMEGIIKEGKGSLTPDNGQTRKEDIKETNSISNTVGSIVATLVIVPGKVVNAMLSILVYTFQDQSQYKFELTDQFTIEDLVMGRYTLFDIDLFNVKEGSNKTMNTLKENINKWYGVMRQIAIAVSLLILIYIGIRMALSTLATDKAKYKRMLTSWVTSIIILFTIHIIAIFFIDMQAQLIKLFEPYTADNKGFEESVIVETWNSLQETEGWNKVKYIVLYYVILYYQLKFVYLYFRRTMSVGFLVTIAPLVTITYAIDKVGDNRAQAFAAWLKELLIHIFIQVLHSIVYIVFIFSAAEIAKKIPFLGIVFLMALSRAEKMVRKTFSVAGEGLADANPIKKLRGK